MKIGPKAGVSLTLVVVVVVASALVIRSREDRAKAQSESREVGFRLCTARAPANERDEVTWNHPLVFALLLALSPDERESLHRALEEANRRWEIKANPFVEDLEEGKAPDPDEPLAKWLEHAPPAVSTALSAAKNRYCATDRFCVRVVPHAEACPPPYEAASDEDPAAPRARFLAWPFGHAIWLRAEDPRGAAAATKTLRDRARASERIGLVVHRSDDEASHVAAGSVRDELVRHEVLRERALHGDSEQNGTDAAAPFGSARGAGAEDDRRGTFPASLGPLDILVLPRLEVVQDPHGFAAELRTAAPDLRVIAAPPSDRR